METERVYGWREGQSMIIDKSRDKARPLSDLEFQQEQKETFFDI